MTGRDPETLLRDALAEETSDLTADPAFVNATVDHSVAILRRTRARNVALAGAAAAVVVALIAWQAPSLVDKSSEQPTKEPDQSQVDNASDWALSLPRGAEADVAYIDGHTLVVGSKHTDLGPRFGNLVETLPGGWFADIGTTDAHGSTTRPVYGELRTDGTFFPYDYQPTESTVGGVAVSPGGTQVAYGDAVVATGFTSAGRFDDAVMGTKTAELPANVSDIIEWNAATLVYRDAEGRLWWWSPGTSPQLAPYDGAVAGGYGYNTRGDCVQVSQYALSSAVGSYRLCDRGHPLTISAEKRGLMSNGELVNIDGGVDFLTLPAAAQAAQLQLLWESGDNLILVVHNTGDRPTPAVLVRCVVSAGLCERASDSLASYPALAAIPGSGH